MESVLHDAETRLAQQADALAAERLQWDAARQHLEQKAHENEAQRISLESVLHDAETRLAQQADALTNERAQWDAIWLELEHKAQAAESQRSKSESCLRDAEARLARQAEVLATERAAFNALRQEMEQKALALENRKTELESALRDAEARLAQQSDVLVSERSQWETTRLEMEQKHQETENQRTSLQIALEEVESYLSRQTEEHASERSQWHLARLELEQRCLGHEEQQAALQNVLRQAEATLANAIEAHNSEHAQWQTARLELEEKCRILDQLQAELKSALRESESRVAQLTEDNDSKAEALEENRQKLAQLHADVQRLEAELAALQLRYQELSRFSSAGMVLTTLDGQVLRCNETAAQMFGFGGDEEAQEHPFKIYAFEGVLKDRLELSGKLENVEWAYLTRDGRLIRLLENASLIAGPSGEPSHVERILTDVSRTHPLSSETRHTRRMESTTDLAAATVKSLQDICASLARCAEALKDSAGDANRVHEIAETLLSDGNRGIKHARQFFSVVKKADRTQELLDINNVLAGNDAMLRNLAGEDIEMQTVLSPRIGLVSANRQELVQLISSLMASSREVLPMGGTVSIETSNVEFEPSAAGHPAEMPAGIYVLLTVAADGCSLQPERRIGSIQTIVDRMGGWLETASTAQSGNVYRIYLPRVEILGPASH